MAISALGKSAIGALGKSAIGAVLEGALSKLTLIAYQDRECKNKLGSIKAMYNPTSVELSYGAEYDPEKYLNAQEKGNKYEGVRPGGLDLALILDAQLPGNQKSVDEELSTLRKMCFNIDSKTNEPPFIRVEWGKMNWHGNGYFSGRVNSLSVSYTLFNRNAKPLRATVQLSMVADEMQALQDAKNKAPKASIIKAVARNALPVMAAVASASVAVGAPDYLSLAYENKLDHFAGIKPGDTLIFGASGADKG